MLPLELVVHSGYIDCAETLLLLLPVIDLNYLRNAELKQVRVNTHQGLRLLDLIWTQKIESLFIHFGTDYQGLGDFWDSWTWKKYPNLKDLAVLSDVKADDSIKHRFMQGFVEKFQTAHFSRLFLEGGIEFTGDDVMKIYNNWAHFPAGMCIVVKEANLTISYTLHPPDIFMFVD